MGGQTKQIDAGKNDGSARQRAQTGDGIEKRGFARAVGADDGQDFAFIDAHAHVADGRELPVANGDIGDIQKGGHGALPSSVGPWRSSSKSPPRYTSLTAALAKTSCGSPSAMTRPPARHTSLGTVLVSARTTCSIHTTVMSFSRTRWTMPTSSST